MKVVLESRKGGGNLVTEEFIVKLQTEFPDVEFKVASKLDEAIEASVDAEIFFGWRSAICCRG